MGLVLLASLLASPISWEHHFVMALIPIAVLLTVTCRADRPEWRRVSVLASGYVLLATNAYDLIRQSFPYLAGRIAISYAFFGAICLWLLLATESGSKRSEGLEAELAT